MDYLTLTIGKQKKIALIAHDSKKRELIGWCDAHKEILKHHFLCGTRHHRQDGHRSTGLPVKGYNSGPLGGDQQIGGKDRGRRGGLCGLFLRPADGPAP